LQERDPFTIRALAVLLQGNHQMKSISGLSPQAALPTEAPIEASVASGLRSIPGPVAPSLSTTPDAIGLLRAFQRRWRLALGLGLLVAAIAAGSAWNLFPPAKYTAEALLLVEAEQPTLIAATKEYRSDPETDRRTQVALIKSLVISKVVVKPEVTVLEVIKKQRAPADWLEQQVKAEFKGKILSVSMTSEDPAEATALVKAVTHTYLDEVANKEKLQRLERNQSLETHYDKLEKKLESKRKLLRGLSTAVGAKDKQSLSMQQRLAVSRQSMAEEELVRTQSDLKRAMAELKVLQNRRQKNESVEPSESGNPVDVADVEKAIQDDPDVQRFLEREQALEAAVERNKRIARNAADPTIQIPRKELADVRKKRRALVDRLRSDLLAQKKAPLETRHQAESSLAALEDQIEVMSDLEQDLRQEVGKFSGDTQKLDSQALEMESIQTEIKSAEEMAKLIGGELEVLKVELQAPDRVRLIKEAKAPLAVDGSRLVKITAMTAVGAFSVITLLVSFWEFRAQRIGTLDEVVNGLGMRVVGTVPLKPSRVSRALPDPAGAREQLWQHQLMESVDATRVMLTHTARVESLRVLLVTSAVGGEGKTSLASHLATSLARSGQRTVLIDGDLRRPMVHHLYDQPPGPGFCELLRGELGPDEVIRPTALSNLWVISAGSYDESALSVLAQPRSCNLFAQFRERFSFIVVDSAPILPVADTLLLGQHVDGALFSILRDVSQLPRIHAAHGRMAALGVPILGAVLSGTTVDTHYRY
jgi:polysaccharide biosynthesis transport protein